MTNKTTERPNAELPDGPLRRVAAAFTEAEIAKIDDWGFANRIRDRTTVLRRLVQRALVQEMPASA